MMLRIECPSQGLCVCVETAHKLPVVDSKDNDEGASQIQWTLPEGVVHARGGLWTELGGWEWYCTGGTSCGGLLRLDSPP